MKGVINFKVIEKPEMLDRLSGKSSMLYAKIISTLDVIGSTKCVIMTPAECSVNVVCLRAALNRILKNLKKDYTAKVTLDREKDLIYIWSRMKLK